MAAWLVVGLGNPGAGYAHNRHNVGAATVDALARRASAAFKPRRLLRAATADIRLGAERVTLATTRVYMNESGLAVRALLADLRLKPDHLVVVHDELDLEPGQLRVKLGGGDNGHNGLKSIRAMTGTGEFYRVRLGIGRPGGYPDVVDWVLTDFTPADREVMKTVVVRAGEAVESLVTAGLEATQSRYNS